MSSLISTGLIIVAFIAVLGPLVALHEWGHYIVARLCGVKVLTYSIGFGPKIASWTSKKTNIDYRISALPLGGYVKMLDEREGEVAEDEKHLAFNNQHPLKKIAIVVAGPVMNFIIAIGLFWVLFLIPSETLSTRIGSILPDSPASAVSLPLGDKVIAVDGHDVQTWQEVNYRLADRMGETGTVRLSLLAQSDTEQETIVSDKVSNNAIAADSKEAGGVSEYDIPIKNYMQGAQSGQDTLTSLGVMPWQPKIEPVIAELVPEGAALSQGMQIGDKIVAIDGKAMDDWLEVTRIIRDNPDIPLTFTVLRDNGLGDTTQRELKITPEAKTDGSGQQYGLIGARSQNVEIPEEYKTTVSYDALTAMGKAFAKTGQLSTMTLKSMGKMIMGKVGLENISGPLTIAVISKQSFDISWQQVLSTAGLISLSLAVLNLLPIPVLDGGHLMYYLIELIRGKPVSEQAQIIGFNIGFLFLICFMILAITNDFSRYF